MHLFSFVHVALAQGYDVITTKPPKVTDLDRPGINDLVGQVCNAATWLFAAAIILSIFFALLGAIEYMRSSGDPAKVKSATNRLIFAGIGVAVALIAFLFPNMIASILNVTTLGKICAV